MGDTGITIPIGDCLPYLELKFRELIGKDPETLEIAAWFGSLQKTAIVQTANVGSDSDHRQLKK